MQKVTNVHLNKVVRATAGAGKTTGLLEEVYQVYLKHYKDHGVYPRILLSTFTIKAANELSERLVLKAREIEDHHFLDFISSGFLEVGTLHSVFSKVLDSYYSFEDREVFYKPESQRSLVGRVFFHEALKTQSFEDLVSDQREEQAILSLFWSLLSNFTGEVKFWNLEALKSRRLSVALDLVDKDLETWDQIKEFVAQEIEKDAKAAKKKLKKIISFLEAPENQDDFLKRHAVKHEKVQRLYVYWREKIRTFLKAEGLFGLHDIEVRLLEILKEDSTVPKRWDFCFFDEYQDTSPIQEKIISILSAQSINYYVGDPFQSIYFFRGARKEIFIDKFNSVNAAAGETQYKLNNYRSGTKIVDFANALSQFMMPDFIPMEPQLDHAGRVDVYYSEEAKVEDELRLIREKIQKIDLTKESVGVLSRKTKYLLEGARLFKQMGLSYAYSSSKGFEKSLEVIELVSFLKFLVHPHDDRSILVLSFSPWLAISDLEIKEAQRAKLESEGQLSLWDTLQEKESSDVLKRYLSLSRNPDKASVLSDFLIETGFLNLSAQVDATEKREENILKLLGALEKEQKKSGFNLMAFCDDILSGKYQFESDEASGEQGCFFMTVHGSKGLQFDHVFVVGMNTKNYNPPQDHYFSLEGGFFALKEASVLGDKKVFPIAVQEKIEKEKKESYRESLRLLYVAMTRAKKTLSLLGSGKIAKTSEQPTWMSLSLKFLERFNLEEDYLREVSQGTLENVNQKAQSLKGGFFKNLKPAVYKSKDSLAVTQNLSPSLQLQGEEKGLFYFTKSIAKGIYFHEVVERVNQKEDVLRVVQNYFGEESGPEILAVNYLFDQKDFPFENLLLKGEREWGFDTELEGGLSGKIDLWGLVDQTLWIVDYKTGSMKDLEKGFEQLEFYTKILLNYLLEQGVKPHAVKKVLTFPYDKKTWVR